MTISNWDSTKREFKTALPGFLIIVSLILILCSVNAFVGGYNKYQTQMEQLDWNITNATVSYVKDRVEIAHGAVKGHYTYYDIYYEYTVNEQVYTGIIEKRGSPKNIGDTFKIKYNPESPDESTYILEPSQSYIGSGYVFGGIGLTLVILSIVLIKKNKRSTPAQKEL